MNQVRKYFGTDGIRGRANQFPMTADMALKVAMATACVLRSKRSDAQTTNRVVIGKDPRLSSYMIEHAMAAGFGAMGMEVILTGPLPTPAIAMLTRTMRCDVGVMISASHNSYMDNGFKLFGPDGFKLDDALELEIEAMIDGDIDTHLAAPEKIGKATRLDDAPGRYIEFIKQTFPKGQTLEGLKIVIDCAHGAAYKIAPQILWELEADVVVMGNTPNGTNINQDVGATAPAAMRARVLAEGADIGLALDGDADRIIMVDEKGDVVDGDQIMALLATTLKQQDKLAKGTLVTTVMSNLGLERHLNQHDIALIRTAVGDRYVMEAMREGDYNFGGEQSGHMIFSDYGTTGDGLLAGLQVLSVLKDSGQKASSLLRAFNPLPQILRNVRFEAGQPLEKEEVRAAIQKAEETLANDGRVLVRASGTEPVIRVMAEGDDAGRIEEIVANLCDIIAKAG